MSLRTFLRQAWFAVVIDKDTSSGLAQQLMAAGIPTQAVRIKKPWETDCLAFPPQYKDKVLAIVGLNGTVKEFNTSNEQVKLLTPYSVQAEKRENLEHWESLVPVLHAYAKKHYLHICVSNPHSKASPPQSEDGKLWIRFWSVPRVSEHTEMAQAYGFDLATDQKDAVPPTNSGIAIVDPNEVTVAEVHGSTLYVLFDLPHGPNAAELLKKILDEYDFMKLPLEEQTRLRNQRLDDLERIACEKYAAACAERSEVYHQRMKEDLAEARAEQSRLSAALTKAVRKELLLEQQLDFLVQLSQDAQARHAEEYKKLKNNPKVARLMVKGNKITVQTVPLITVPTASGHRYALGQYLITIPFDGGNPTTLNITQTVAGTHHPFDTGNGRLCYGNISGSLAEYMGSLEYSAVVQLVIEFLESSVSESRLKNWPIYEEES